jgi:hypothetical protein
VEALKAVIRDPPAKLDDWWVLCTLGEAYRSLEEVDCRTQSDEEAKTNKNTKFVAAWNSDAFPGTSLLGALLFPWLWTVVPNHVAGWILTAIAASLGAPFWFDTLNKFMNVRAAGTSPREKGTDKSKL